MGKQRAIKLNLNRTFNESEYEMTDSMHIKDKENTVGFSPACVFDEEQESSGRILKRVRRLAFLLPALVLFIFGFNIGGVYQFLLLMGGLVSLVIGVIIMVILTIRKSGGRKLILFVDGCLNALKFSEKTEDLQIAWSQQEAKEYVQKQIALEQERFKVMKTWQFMVIMVLLVIIAVLIVKLGATVGAF